MGSKKVIQVELIYKTEIDSQTEKLTYGYQKGEGEMDKLGVWN